MPKSRPDPAFNVVPLLVDRHVDEGRGGRPALVTPEATVTYAELAAGVARAAHALIRLGLRAEDRVALLLPDSPEFVFVFLGAQKAGLVPVPLSTFATPDECAYAIEDSCAATVVVHGQLYSKLEALAPGSPSLRHRLVVGGAPPGALDFAGALAAEAAIFETAPTRRDDMAYWLYSSGTTGRPKAVVHRHRDMPGCIDPYARDVLALGPADRTFAVPRLFFSYGLGACLYLPLWVGASAVLVTQRPDPAATLALIARMRPTVFFSVPTSVAALLAQTERTPVDLSSLRLVVSAGEPLPARLHDDWVRRTGVECLDGLGATEVGFIYVSNRPGAVRPGASGRLLPGYRIRIVGEDGADVATGQVGELWVSGESVAAGYWNRPDRTAAAFVGEWYRTGDRYRQDADGYLFYQGRTDDLLRVAGHWVSPLEVEACLLDHPAVAECAVVGAPDADGLVKPRACVVLRPGASGDGLEAALVAHARARLPRFKAPRWVTVVTELPRTATGKLQRFRLRDGPGV